MPKTLQIRDVDDAVYAGLVRHAAEAGVTVPELLRRHATRLAARPTTAEWLARTERRTSAIATTDVIDTVDELRGAWPDAGR
jgi:antitoxin FitA